MFTPKYLENDSWPIAQDSQGTQRMCADNYGDVECPFCDVVICREGDVMDIGTKCWRCSAIVINFEKLR